MYKYFESFIPSTYKFGMAHKLAYRCLIWTILHNQLIVWKKIFQKSSFPEKFINECFKKFMDNILEFKEASLKVKKKTLVLVLFLQYPNKLGLSWSLNHLKTFLTVANYR